MIANTIIRPIKIKDLTEVEKGENNKTANAMIKYMIVTTNINLLKKNNSNSLKII